MKFIKLYFTLLLFLLTSIAEYRTADAVTFRAVSGRSRGYLTTPQELLQFRALATRGIQPHYNNVSRLIRDAGNPNDWDYGYLWGEFAITSVNGLCYSVNNREGDNFINENEGGHEVYRKAIAYYLTGDVRFAEKARLRVIDLTDTWGFGGDLYSGGNQCILDLAFSMPLWITTADLLRDTPAWSDEDEAEFSRWLAEEIYPKVAWASRARANNWGSSGSLTAAMIADFLANSDIMLEEYAPVRRTLTPAEAFYEHNDLQRRRMNGSFRGDSQCAQSGIQPYGGIPDELRRGETGCGGRWIRRNDSSLSYQTIHIEHLVFHAEFMLRRGDDTFYRSDLIRDAIYFVIANPFNMSIDWVDKRRGTLFVAYQYYCDPLIAAEARQLSTFKGGNTLPYAKLTHPLNECRDELPIAAPPSRVVVADPDSN